jgi:hypothetical protein
LGIEARGHVTSCSTGQSMLKGPPELTVSVEMTRMTAASPSAT